MESILDTVPAGHVAPGHGDKEQPVSADNFALI